MNLIRKMEKHIYAALLTMIFIGLALSLSLIPSSDQGHLTGNAVGTKLLVLTSENGTCIIELNKEWNLRSFLCRDPDMTPESYFGIINSSIISVHTYDSSISLNRWKAYNPNLPSWVVQSLTDIKREEGYWIRMKNDSVFTKNGSIVKPTQIQLKKGWNLAGYPTENQRNVSQSLRINMGSDFSYVYMYNSSDIADPWKVYLTNAPAFVTLDLDNFTREYGYWINASKTGEWYVNY